MFSIIGLLNSVHIDVISFLDVVWFRGSTWNLIEDTEKYDVEISQNKECHFITLFNVNSSHSGKYSCIFSAITLKL